MRQINFIVIFVISLALVLFGIENTEPAVIHVVQGIEIEAPLSVELIVAMGIGAVFAWVFSVWAQVQNYLTTKRQVHKREVRIQELEQDVERYRVELEQQPMLPASQKKEGDSDTSEAYAS